MQTHDQQWAGSYKLPMHISLSHSIKLLHEAEASLSAAVQMSPPILAILAVVGLSGSTMTAVKLPNAHVRAGRDPDQSSLVGCSLSHSRCIWLAMSWCRPCSSWAVRSPWTLRVRPPCGTWAPALWPTGPDIRQPCRCWHAVGLGGVQPVL